MNLTIEFLVAFYRVSSRSSMTAIRVPPRVSSRVKQSYLLVDRAGDRLGTLSVPCGVMELSIDAVASPIRMRYAKLFVKDSIKEAIVPTGQNIELKGLIIINTQS